MVCANTVSEVMFTICFKSLFMYRVRFLFLNYVLAGTGRDQNNEVESKLKAQSRIRCPQLYNLLQALPGI